MHLKGKDRGPNEAKSCVKGKKNTERAFAGRGSLQRLPWLAIWRVALD